MQSKSKTEVQLNVSFRVKAKTSCEMVRMFDGGRFHRGYSTRYYSMNIIDTRLNLLRGNTLGSGLTLLLGIGVVLILGYRKAGVKNHQSHT